MSQSARFRRGFGRLTPTMLTQAMTASERVMRQETAITQAVSDHVMAPLRGQTILAQITGATETDNTAGRWDYEWQEVEITDLGVQLMSDGLAWDDDDQRPAWNLCELLNIGSGIAGPGWDLDSAPVGFELKPIDNCCVILHSYIDTEGEQRWVFQMANVLDGECEEEEE